MEKKCNKCKKIKDITQFKFRADNKYDCYCKSCRSEYQKERYSKTRISQIEKNTLYRINSPKKTWFQELKSQLSCSKCGENHPACLEFHHKNPQEKEFTISSMIGRKRKELILEEIKKCVVLCANCHRKEHYNT